MFAEDVVMPESPQPSRHPRSDVGLAEIVQALHDLQPENDPTRAAIAGSLGLGWQATQPETDASEVSIATVHDIAAFAEPPSTLTPELRLPTRAASTAGPEEAEPEMLAPVSEEPPTLEVLFGAPVSADIEEVKPAMPAHLQPPERLPLLRPQWFRGIASSMLATSQPSRDIDWRFLERRLVQGLPLERLPWRSRPTLKRGTRVLLDQSESMQPFWRDAADLVAQLRRLVGQRSIRECRFRLDPWRPVESQWRWVFGGLRQFAFETPLLIVSDFGIARGRGIGPKPWLEVMRRAQLDRCPIVALVPAPRSAWPFWLNRLVPHAFVWDRETSPQAIRRLLLRIH
jgi:hypothetical protein